MQINDLVKISYETAVNKGWHDKKRAVPELLCLMHSEISEALEDYRKGLQPNQITLEAKKGKPNKPGGIPIELADVIIRIADFCGMHEIDLDRAIQLKLNYNEQRAYRHGNKVC